MRSVSEGRRRGTVGNRAKNFAEAEEWDLEYWQPKTPEERLSALVAARRDVEVAQAARREADLELEGDRGREDSTG